MVSYWNQPRALKQGSLRGAGGPPGSLHSHVAGDVYIGDGHLWSGCLGNRNLSQALTLQKRENPTIRVYTTNTCKDLKCAWEVDFALLCSFFLPREEHALCSILSKRTPRKYLDSTPTLESSLSELSLDQLNLSWLTNA